MKGPTKKEIQGKIQNLNNMNLNKNPVVNKITGKIMKNKRKELLQS